ncbi:MAG: ZIP family metal transporter [Actinomycetota bacterium]
MDEQVWIQSFVAVAGISALSLAGSVVLVMSREALRKALFVVVAFAAGALLGDAFFHLIPEIAESEAGFGPAASAALLTGVIALFVLEKVLHWHHSHFPEEEVLHPIAVMNLVGDGLHNLLDGAIVTASFAVSLELGIATSVAVALHEIPQEIGDFGILLHAGLAPRRALLLNFASGLAALMGALLVLLFASVDTIEGFLVPFSAGAFIYIASTDLLPDLHKEAQPARSAVQLIALLLGVGTMAALLYLES